MTTAPDPRQANGGAERGDHVALLLIRHEETAGQDAQPQVSGPVQDPVLAASALLDPATPCDRPEAAPGNFTDCYRRELPAIRHPRAWLRRVAERGYYRRGFRETLVESPPERPEPLATASDVELRDEARAVLAVLAALPPKQRQAAMTHEGTPAMQQDGTLAMTHEGTPAMQQDGTLAMTHEGTPAMQQDGTLAAVRQVRPAPWDEVRRAPWEIGRPAPWDDATLTTYQKSAPGMQGEATPAGMPSE
jgi:hypothetical protein